MPRPAPERPRRSSLTPFYAILGVVLLVGIGFLVTQATRKKNAGANAPPQAALTLTPEQLQRVKGISRGRDDAPITIYEFADFQCPHCAQYAALLEPVILERLVDTGKARYVFYEFPLGFKWSWLAARAGRCANEQGKFWDFHTLLFARQGEWAFDTDPLTRWRPLAEQAGMDGKKFEECVRSDRYLKDVTESQQLGNSLGVGGTPTLFVNGRKLDSPAITSYAAFEAEVRRIAPSAFGDSPAPAAAPAGPTAPIGQTPAPGTTAP